MRRFFGLFCKGQGQPPHSGASLPCVAAAYEIREKDLGRLHRAATGGDLAQVQRRRWLLRLGINRQDKEKRTPLHLACANGHSEVVKYLVENKCKLNACDSFKRSPLMKAVQCQQEECVAILLAHGADHSLADADGNTALHLAARAPNISLAGQLLEHNAHIEAQNKMGHTPLSLAVTEHHKEMVEFLLQKGSDVHARDPAERTPLMLAASAGDMSVVEVLLRYGADVSQKDIFEWTAEDYARKFGRDQVSEQLADYTDGEKAGEASAGCAKGVPALSTPPGARPAGFALGAPALDREVRDGFSQEGFVGMCEEEQSDESCPASEKEKLSLAAKEESPEREGEEVTDGPQVPHTAEDLAGMRDVTLAAAVDREEDPRDSQSLHSLPACPSPEAAAKLQESADEREKLEGHKAATTQTDFQYGGQAVVGQLQEEAANALEKQLILEGSLEVTKLYCSELKEDKLRLQEELDRVKAKLQESEEQRIQAEHCVQELKAALENKQRETVASSQKLQDLLEASLGTINLKQLEERVRRLELENARLEGTAQQQTVRTQVLQKDLQAAASVHSHLEDLITGLPTKHVPSEEDQNQQCRSKGKPLKTMAEWTRPTEARLEQVVVRNIELQEERNRSQRLLEEAMKKLRMYERQESESQLNFQDEMEGACSGMGSEVGRLRTEVRELSRWLEAERRNSRQLERTNKSLQEDWTLMHGSLEKLRKRKRLLEEEVGFLRCQVNAKMRDHSQREQYKRESEQRAGQKLQQKLQEVNLLVQTQAATHNRTEQIRATAQASMAKRLRQRIRDLELEAHLRKQMQ
ncbi:POTE ankyrin domain family member B-like [Apteryx mantelli]|uniref:POTE ankyrin domain family member B-like n=1 Tax=Apteryx mantelli TaxID=2696672 RepID=A0ABM4G5V0_9AVES